MNVDSILCWSDIAEKYNRSTILLGNGSSIAVNDCFQYQSLLEIAKREFSQDNIDCLFEYFDTKDFELILRLIWWGKEIIDITKEKEHKCIHYNRLVWIYEDIRNGLIKAVRKIHPNYSSIGIDKLEKISNFLVSFDTVVSLNYDLIVYWASLIQKDKKDSPYSFKDCFIRNSSKENGFKDDWKKLRAPIREAKFCTLIFYPHGNLILYKKLLSEFKVFSNESSDLLETILEEWSGGDKLPLFVSEGTAEQKLRSIRDSYYLSIVYREVLTERKENLVIYGWGFGEQDIYILKQMRNCGIRNVAVSVYNKDMEYCSRVSSIIKKELGGSITIEFFHSDSKRCWIY